MKRNIIITGGDDGLGRAIAKLLSEKNNVITISKTEENTMRISKEIPSAECYTCDITKPEEVNNTIKTIIENQGDIDILYIRKVRFFQKNKKNIISKIMPCKKNLRIT